MKKILLSIMHFIVMFGVLFSVIPFYAYVIEPNVHNDILSALLCALYFIASTFAVFVIALFFDKFRN